MHYLAFSWFDHQSAINLARGFVLICQTESEHSTGWCQRSIVWQCKVLMSGPCRVLRGLPRHIAMLLTLSQDHHVTFVFNFCSSLCSMSQGHDEDLITHTHAHSHMCIYGYTSHTSSHIPAVPNNPHILAI